MSVFRQLLLVGTAGALGSIARYGVSVWALRKFGTQFAYGTFIVNIVGCLLLGALLQFSLCSEVIARVWRLPVAVGFLGALTTFSTFSYETVHFAQQGAWTTAGLNVLANLVCGFCATWAGIKMGTVLFSGG